MLFELITVLLIVFFFPYIVVGVVLGKIFTGLREVFYLPVLMAAVGTGGLACITWLKSTPDNSRQFVSLMEAVSQSSFGGLPMPYVAAGVALGLFVASMSKMWTRKDGS